MAQISILVLVFVLMGCSEDSGYVEDVSTLWKPDLRAQVKVEMLGTLTRIQQQVVMDTVWRVNEAVGARVFEIVPAIGHVAPGRIFVGSDNDLPEDLVSRLVVEKDNCQVYVPDWTNEAVITHQLLRCIGFAPVQVDVSDVMFQVFPNGNEIKPYVIGEILGRINTH